MAWKIVIRQRMDTHVLEHTGLPVAPGFTTAFPSTITFDIDEDFVQALRRGEDWTGQALPDELAAAHLTLTQ